ncbi:MAG: hypothetical protein ACLQBA_23065 [Candidatus Binataceae bacterium]
MVPLDMMPKHVIGKIAPRHSVAMIDPAPRRRIRTAVDQCERHHASGCNARTNLFQPMSLVTLFFSVEALNNLKPWPI